MSAISSRTAAGLLASLALVTTIAACGDPSPSRSTRGAEPSSVRHAPSPRAVDQAFVRQMIPHHRLAVQMAKVAETHGEHREIRRLASTIVAAQTKEIAQLTAIGTSIGARADQGGAAMSEDAATLGLPMDRMGMSMDTRGLAEADPFDRAFIDEMTPHHRGAIAMADAELARGRDSRLRTIAKAIEAAQRREMAEMATWRERWYPAQSSPAVR